jgi:transcriptional regulator with XRE-family HTH domain
MSAEPQAPSGGVERLAVEATQRIAERLTSLRLERRLRIAELARQVSVSPSLISQIERGQSLPSVTTLFALARQLDVPVDALFREPTEESPVVTVDEPGSEPPRARAGRWVITPADRPALEIHGGVRWERLSRAPLGGLEFMELVYRPHAESSPQLYRHPGLECVLVTENVLDIAVGDELNRLYAGDSICFPSALQHRYVNPTDRDTRAITAILRDWKGAAPA